jgi:hypothetical protein
LQDIVVVRREEESQLICKPVNLLQEIESCPCYSIKHQNPEDQQQKCILDQMSEILFQQDGAPPHIHHIVAISEQPVATKIDWQRWTNSMAPLVPRPNPVTFCIPGRIC